MSADVTVRSLLRLANKIAAAHPPHHRQSQWKTWCREVRLAERDHPEINRLGLTLAYGQFSDDLRTLGQYAEVKPPSPSRTAPRVVPTETSDCVKIFISHRAEDAALAKSIKKMMEVLAAGRLLFHISEEMPKGTDWYKWIKDRLVESRMLLLLFTDNTAAWDWCLYEAGLFTQWDDDTRRIICLHTSRQPPAPLNHLQSVPALGEEISLFLRQLLVETELTGLESPLNATLASNPAELKRAAEKIAKAMRREAVRQDYLTRCILINIERPTRLVAEGIPDDAVIDSDAESLALFNKKMGKWTWGDLVGGSKEGAERRWIVELNRAVRQASSRSLVDPILATLRVRQTGRSYRPVLHRVSTKSDGSQQFTVLFVEDGHGKHENSLEDASEIKRRSAGRFCRYRTACA
jgi:TIR domain